MLNRYPLWKYIMVLITLVIGIVYALPNLYGEDPAVQISGARGASVDMTALDSIKQTLESNDLSYQSIALEDGTVLARFKDTEAQISARDALMSRFDSDDYVVALNLAPATPSWLDTLGATPMKLGLDLRGGVHFLMEVDMDAALEKLITQQEDSFRTDLREARIRYRGLRIEDNTRVVVNLRNAEDTNKALELLSNNYLDMNFSVDEDEGRLAAVYKEERLKEIRNYAVAQNITILRNRVNELGVAEPLVQRQGASRIVVELPGVQDTARAKEILGATATLEFREVDQDADLSAAMAGRVPPGSELMRTRDGRPAVLKKRVILTGSHITDASSSRDEYSRPQVNISLDSEGGDKMADFSKRNIGELMATVFAEYKDSGERDEDGKVILEKHEEVINQATIQSALGRNFRITGIDSAAEAHNLALLLRAGALIAPISIVEERTIGPSMGQQNINMGVQACIWGLVAVMLFTLIYYRRFGLFANCALLANIVLIIGIMSLIPGATMTLPGIAGIVLTVGMAVDANVLIFERIREEIHEGRNPQHAIDRGYSNAFSTIADANITTLITAIILFAVGTGAIKGFAVTLSIGILTSMFTAIIGTRALVNLVYGGKRVKKLSI
ncbi:MULTISPECIES: protein translocase subunit SecD [unclassified Salinivibrio]|uniref:protein translocase subunit SecD n=1 Tax=unclassified Salinivibrio TaxID=2636825 RepID=UPI0012CB9ADF|nr:protein translocase subunit SecD [Salinivibrio sp. VYel7]MPX94409.1 protein translocase subunit SecD [Salinivibrio sp. VYel9]MPX96313.1 protein translocase subunit SecD [Salinivibrio sp. VYel6]MPY00695.1 protein translocase subunit SecD [Salinivibrio sp. VYel4]MPY03708.1 protein translocase subunit SecD [Salinivibrio sp. VYel5]MPY06688.1 protein translocase subunit SecD [Salinivibrio sp. VYel8]MPY14655.1 protein translocase subunit SecD [Salinivibrio sp. VGrn1]